MVGIILKDRIIFILDKYLNAKQREFKGNNVASSFREFRDDIESLLDKFDFDKEDYIIKTSAHFGWTEIPWVRILNKNFSESIRVGFYPEIIFKSDMSSVYLTISYDWWTYYTNFGDGCYEVLEEDIGYLRDKIKNNFGVDYRAKLTDVGNFESSYIISKEYSEEDLTSGSVNIEEDLKEFLTIYEQIIDETFLISVETWKFLLANPNIINEQMLTVLNVINENDGEISINEISKIVKNQYPELNKGNIDKLIDTTSEKVKKNINKKPLYGIGREIFWEWLFNLKHISGQNDYRLKLKDNLKIALNESKDDLSIEDFEPEDEIIYNPNENKKLNDENNIKFYEYLIKKGYYFDKELIENYLLSLKVKPFLILTGNSGTGKTKIAQLFAQFISNKYNNENFNLKFKKAVGKSGKNDAWLLSNDVVYDILEPKFRSKEFPIIVDGIETIGKVQPSGKIFFNDKSLKNHLQELGKKDPKKEIELEIILDEKDNNSSIYKIIPVGSNWTDNRNILGYYNVITREYQSTPSYDLIEDANKNWSIPHFLVLDEMNLSHVERYFADFLSAIESKESIPLYTGEIVEGNVPKELELPENLITIGTVNVDETTYMFSPKVLDRANTIEFSTKSVKDYMNHTLGIDEPIGDLEYLEDPLSDIELRSMNINQLEEYLNNDILWVNLSNEIEKFRSILEKSGFDFGFRVTNEIICFMIVAFKYENKNDDFNWERYFDAQIKQKILPKLHGSQRSIGNTLNELFKLCMNDNENLEDIKNIKLTQKNTKYYQSAIKLQKMIKILSNQKYVSFIN